MFELESLRNERAHTSETKEQNKRIQLKIHAEHRERCSKNVALSNTERARNIIG